MTAPGDMSDDRGADGKAKGPRQAGALMAEGPSPAACVREVEAWREWWRPILGMTPHIPEGRATFDALVPDRFKRKQA